MAQNITEKNEEKIKKNLEFINKMIISCDISNKQLVSLKKIEDPVLRHHFFIQLLKMLFTSLPVVMEILKIERDDLGSEEIIKKTDNLDSKIKLLSDNLDRYFDDLSSWVISPTYSPDHPFGKLYMKNVKKHYDSHAEIQNKNEKDELIKEISSLKSDRDTIKEEISSLKKEKDMIENNITNVMS